MNTQFYGEMSESSKVKCEIVTKYFFAWFKVIKTVAKGMSNKILYADLFCGPGVYEDGSKTAPIRILESTLDDAELKEMLVTLFNDKESRYTDSLRSEIDKIPNIDTLKYQPTIITSEINQEVATYFEGVNLIPTLSFIDPWGYKGLTLDLIHSLTKDWGSDSIFFFNYNRINMAITNGFVEDHIKQLFGEERLADLQERYNRLSPEQKEAEIMELLTNALIEEIGNYVLPFRFQAESTERTSHYLIFVSKHPKGYEIMKEIMAKYSSKSVQGVPSFEYVPATIEQPVLFDFYRPLDDLASMLLEEFNGTTKKMIEIYNEHNIGRRFIKKNYKDILCKLESEGRIIANPSIDCRQKRNGQPTCGDNTLITFPLAE